MPDPSTIRPAHGGNLTWAASLAGCLPHAVLDFSASINPLGPPLSALDAIHQSLAELRHYPDPTYRSLRHALGQSHGLTGDWVLPGNGSAELLTWASRELAALDATYLLTPAFGDYRRALAAFDALILCCPLSLEVEATLPLPPPQPHCGLLLNNPHNPSGLLFSRESLRPWLDRFDLIVIDEAFMDFLPPAQQQSLINWVPDYPNLVILRSLTKFYSLPGLRLGYAIAHPERLQRWQAWRDPWAVNTLAVAAAEAVLTDTAFQQQTWNWLPPTRTQLLAGLAALPSLHPFPSAVNYLLVQSDRSVIALQKGLLLQHQILIRDCLSFAELGDRFFRVAVRTEADNQRLLAGLRSLLLQDG